MSTQPSPFITLCAVGAINAVQATPAVPIFVSTHIGRSTVCQTEGKGIYTVHVQYKPSGRAEDQEARPVGAGGAWPVRPAAPVAAPGKHIVCNEWHIVCYYIAYDVVGLYRMFLAM